MSNHGPPILEPIADTVGADAPVTPEKDGRQVPDPPSHPKAIVVTSASRWSGSWVWLTIGFSLIVALVLAASSMWRHGPRITIHFADGRGLKAGDLVQYRGISVGEVTGVALISNRDGVECTVLLEPSAAWLARRGSDFWIERPRISLSRISGLETVIGAKYVSVRPGPAGGPLEHHFQGVESPPSLIESDPEEVTIRFSEGYGLQTGDPVRFRGIVIGEVAAVDLDPELTSVAVRVHLGGAARRLACEGSQFWVERPRLGVTEVRGLDTIVGGRYIAVMPGAANAPPCIRFTGLDAPLSGEVPTGAIEILLHAPQRWGIDRGIPVTYRGLKVGQVHSVGLSSDGTRIEARAWVEAKYRQLVRRNSVFWSTSGIDLDLGLTGLKLSAESLTTIAQGGLEFATPNAFGEPASTGQRFPFQRKSPDGVADWSPHIDLLQTVRVGNVAFPQPQRAVARWSEKSFGFRRRYERTGFVVFLDDHRLLAPADILLPTERPMDDVLLEVAGVQITVGASQVQRRGMVAEMVRDETVPDGVSTWPAKRVRTLAEPEDILLVLDSQTAPHPVAASGVKLGQGQWELEDAAGFAVASHGAPVVAVSDGQLLGLLIFHKGKPAVVGIMSP